MMVQPGPGCRTRAASSHPSANPGPAWGFSRSQRHALGLELRWKEAAVEAQDGSKQCRGPGSWGLRAWVDDRLVVEIEQLPSSADEEEEGISRQQRLSGSDEAAHQPKGADGSGAKIQLPTYSLTAVPQATHQPPYGVGISGVGGHGNGNMAPSDVRESAAVGGGAAEEADYVQGVLLTCFYGGSKKEWAAPRDTAVRLGAFSVYTSETAWHGTPSRIHHQRDISSKEAH